MSRFILITIVFLALVGAVFFAFELTRNQEDAYAPETVFGPKDETILLVNRIDELSQYNLLNEGISNPVATELSANTAEIFNTFKIFVSGKRPVVVFQKDSRWSKKEAKTFKNYFKDTRTKTLFVGDYLVAFHDTLSSLKGFQKGFFIDGDKKASGSIWNYRNSYEDWVRTDIYALEDGLFKYQTEKKHKSQGIPIAEEAKFTTVLPENIEKYEFYERFYASNKDSVFANGLMNEWINEGYVKATLNGEVFIISDNRVQQKPALILLDHSEEEDSIDYTSSIKSFTGFQLTKDFPSNKNNRIYLLELEDKTIMTESKDLAQKIQLIYSLGETIALNTEKSKQFFNDLPKSVNYRYVDKQHKKSVTVSEKIIFEVSTLPPGENLIMQEVNNWSKALNFDKIAGVKAIKDHIRGGYSLFVYNQKGGYELLNTNGDLIFEGSFDTSLIGEVSVVDLYNNERHQLLFTTSKSINLIDLNGNQVGQFPYKTHHPISSPPSYYTWKGSMRFLFATSNGELITVNSTGQELNVVQASQGAIYEKPYALNINGNLRGWYLNKVNTTGLSYLEKPIRSEVLGKSQGTYFHKSNSSVEGWFEKNENVFKIQMKKPETAIPFGEGKIINVSGKYVITQKKNELFFYTANGDLQRSLKIPFNEVGDVIVLYHNGKNYIGVFDFLENNFYLFEEGELVSGFPKEARKFVEVVIDKEAGILFTYTQINENIICYKHPLN